MRPSYIIMSCSSLVHMMCTQHYTCS
ncbi:hypothetical protein F383_02291 [Gossypium arboreum]|uniref:Uncharacterized protein n=1 Tax=Gossypium arboreum TaxID=29729 RepID=A0A0B0PCD3_GOSAR|nr:hypothetical protein F383_02291 [Gossypium arboreum]